MKDFRKLLEEHAKRKAQVMIDSTLRPNASDLVKEEHTESFVEGHDSLSELLLQALFALNKYKSLGAYSAETDGFNDWAAKNTLEDIERKLKE